MLKAILWDCDNTLINTAELHFAKHVAVLKGYGIDLDDRFRPTIYANNSFQNWEILSKAFDIDTDETHYISQIDAWYKDNINTLQIRAGVKDVLDAAKAQNIVQAVVWNGRKESVMMGLEAKGLLPYFDLILTRDDYEERKPHPRPYLAALSQLNIDATNAVAIEDDPKGVASSIAAHIPTVHFRYTENMPAEEAALYSCYSGTDFSTYMEALIHG